MSSSMSFLAVVAAVHALATTAAAAGVGAIPSTASCPIPADRYIPGTIVVPVSTADDFNKRLQYNSSRHVTLEVQNDISNVHWVFNSSFSNTTLVSRCGVGYTISSLPDANITVAVNAASNVFIHALNITRTFTANASLYTGYSLQPYCTDTVVYQQRNWFARHRYFYSGRPCAAVLIADSNRVQIVGNSIYGPVHVVNASNGLIDGNFITTLDNDVGLWLSNNGSNINVTYSPLIARNNWLNASEGMIVGILGVSNAIGIQITNNKISNFRWSGLFVSTGAISNYFAYNFLQRDPGYAAATDSGSIYIAGHRYGVNNTFVYNYINQSAVWATCIYNDYWTAGTRLDTNICHANNGFSYKLNMGWDVRMTNTLFYNSHATFAGYCESVINDTCSYIKPPSPTALDNPAWQALAPYAKNMCSASSINGIPCSTNDTLLAAAGNCSGLSLLNYVKVAAINSAIYGPVLPLTSLVNNTKGYSCAPYPSADLLNTYNATGYKQTNVTIGSDGFVRVVPGSRLAADMPSLASFPYESLGFKPSDPRDMLGIVPPVLPAPPTATLAPTSASTDSASPSPTDTSSTQGQQSADSTAPNSSSSSSIIAASVTVPLACAAAGFAAFRYRSKLGQMFGR